MDKFMVVCTFKEGTVMSDVYGVINVFPISAPGKQGAES